MAQVKGDQFPGPSDEIEVRHQLEKSLDKDMIGMLLVLVYRRGENKSPDIPVEELLRKVATDVESMGGNSVAVLAHPSDDGSPTIKVDLNELHRAMEEFRKKQP